MTINERIKQLRKIIKINQKDFANKLGITQSGVSYIEQPNTIVAEKTIKTICSIFSVNESWLYNGVEPIFNESESFELDKFAKSKGATELEIEILKAYFDMDEELRKQMINHFISYFKNNNVYDDTNNKDDIYNKAKEFTDKQFKESNNLNINDKNIKML